MGSSSRRRPKCAWTAVRTSSGRPRSITVSAVRNGSIRTGPASKPRPRRIRPKCNQFRVRTVPGSGTDGAGEELPGARAAQPFEILLVFDDGTERRLDRRLVELHFPKRDQRAGPVQRLSNPGQLIEVEVPDATDERAHLAGQLFGHVRHTGRDDLVLAVDRRVVDPEVQTAALEGVVDLAGSIGGDDDRRRLVRLDGADFRNRDLEVGEQLEEESLEFIVRAIDFVDQQDRGCASIRLDRLQEWALDQELRAVDLALGL